MSTTTTTPATTLPNVGDFATHNITCYSSTAVPVEIIEVSRTGHKITTRQAAVIPTGDMPGDMARTIGTYAVIPDKTGEVSVFTRRRNGHYVLTGTDYSFLHLDEVRAYSALD